MEDAASFEAKIKEIVSTAAEAATLKERTRCLTIVGMARYGEIDSDLRTLIHFIQSGRDPKQITTED